MQPLVGYGDVVPALYCKKLMVMTSSIDMHPFFKAPNPRHFRSDIELMFFSHRSALTRELSSFRRSLRLNHYLTNGFKRSITNGASVSHYLEGQDFKVVSYIRNSSITLGS